MHCCRVRLVLLILLVSFFLADFIAVFVNNSYYKLDRRDLLREQTSLRPDIDTLWQEIQDNKIIYYKAQVLRVLDGDTIEVLVSPAVDGLSSCRVRYIGINTPEIAHNPGEHDQPFARKAMILNASLVGNRTLYLVPDVELYDKYGRCLFYVFTSDGIMVNWALWYMGYAKTLSIPPNTKLVFH